MPHFGKLLSRAPSARYMIVRSGTSRLVVLDGSEIRPGAAGRNEVLRLMKGDRDHGGLGGSTLQENKVALVWPEEREAAFRFRFLQVIPETGSVLPMECCNGASSAAMLAQLGGYCPGRTEAWRAVNLSTGQKMELRPRNRQGIAQAWRIRFLASQKSRKTLGELNAPKLACAGDLSIPYHPVVIGNLFLFAEIDPEQCSPEIVDAVEQAGLEEMRKCGMGGTGYRAKVIPYNLQGYGSPSVVRSASYYCGERHRSFPGSAAMALAAFLESRRAGSAGKARVWRIVHPSGEIDVELGYPEGSGAGLIWSELTTPVELLAWGSAFLPWRSRN